MANEAKKVENKLENAANSAQAKMTEASAMLQGLFSVYTSAARSALEGTVEVDKLILNKLGDAAKDTAEYGRELLQVRDFNSAMSAYTKFAEARLNKSVADTKEVLDVAKTRAEDVIAPFKAYA